MNLDCKYRKKNVVGAVLDIKKSPHTSVKINSWRDKGARGIFFTSQPE